ncbi:MAG TPA: flagellar biosynthesis anti-sigma factor FlgM [Terracidiphilus sp.]|nr:flagellar biosynthesis anti-sigma factor FlgM [Terracidiphilus sp.]
MEIRNSAENLKNLLGVNPASSTTAQQIQSGKKAQQDGTSALAGDQATFSNLGQEASQAARGTDVRTEKVATIQAALTDGTYHVPAKAVAHKIVDSLLSRSTPSDSAAMGASSSVSSLDGTGGDTDTDSANGTSAGS